MFEVLVKSGTSTISVDLLLFSMNTMPRMISNAAMPPMTEPMMIFFLRALAAASRCMARVFVAVLVPGTVSNWPVTGLNVCVAAVPSLGFIATVAGPPSISACLRAFMFFRSVRGLNDAARGWPPFMNVSRSFLNSEAVAYRFWRSFAIAFAQIESHMAGSPGTMALGGVATSETCW